MPNTYVNKVTLSNGTTLIDLTSDTVTSAAHIVSGRIGHLADGSQVTGTGSGGGAASIEDVPNATGTTAVIDGTDASHIVEDYDLSETALGSDGTVDLSEAIEALTTYSNEVTGESDSDLSSAVATLIAGFSSGGGATVVASGEFKGASSGGRQTINIGNKMASTDFYLLIKAKNDSEFVRNSNYSFTFLALLCLRGLREYNLANNGTCTLSGGFSIYDDNSGTLTEKTAGASLIRYAQNINNNTFRELIFNTFTLSRNNTTKTFSIYIGQGNTVYDFPTNITYEYKIVYFGDSPATDIVEIE